MLGWLAGLLTSMFGRWLSDNLTRMIILKGLLVFLMVTILPIVLINTFDYILGEVMDSALMMSRDYMPSDTLHVILRFTGFGAWAAQRARIPEAITIVTTAMSIRYVLNFIPFVK